MRLKRISTHLLAILMMLLFCIPNVCAIDDAVAYTDFEDWTTGVKSPWTLRSYTASVADTERGKSLMLTTSSESANEFFYDFTATAGAAKSILLRYSANFADMNGSRQIYVKSSSAEYIIVTFTNEGKVKIGSSNVDGMTFATGKWYDIAIVYVPSTGDVRITMNASGTKVSGSGNCARSEQSGIKRINFYAYKTANPSTTYVDDVYVGAFDYIPAAFTSSSGERYDFENYTASDGITPPTKWAFVNGEEGKAFGVSDADSSGNAVKLVSDGTKAFEMVRNIPSPYLTGKSAIEFDLKRSDGSGVQIGIRGYNAEKILKKDLFFAKMDANGKLTVGDASVTLNPDVWYRFKMNFDSEAGTCSVTVDGSDVDFTETIPIPGDVVSVSRFDIYTPSSKTATYTLWVDNVYIGTEQSFGVCDINPNYDFVNASIDCITITFSGSVNAQDLLGAKFMLNGRESYFNGYEINNDKVILNLATPLDFGKFYMFEAIGLGDDNLSVAGSFLTKKQTVLYNHNLTTDSSAVVGNISAYSTDEESYDITLLLAIYNKETGEMIDLTASKDVIGGEQTDIYVSLPLPKDAGVYEACLFVWDGVDTMQSLSAPMIIEIK